MKPTQNLINGEVHYIDYTMHLPYERMYSKDLYPRKFIIKLGTTIKDKYKALTVKVSEDDKYYYLRIFKE